MFKIRTTPVAYGTKPYDWSADCTSIYQCTWFCFYRAIESGMTAPTYWDRPTRTGSYTDAKKWLDNFREPWQVKDRNYKAVAGDIAVFDGNYGHVMFLETDEIYSEYRSGNPNSFKNGRFADVDKSNLIGYLHYPSSIYTPVERNENVNQIETFDEGLRVRSKPTLSGDVLGHVQLGYYNVLQQKNADGYTWYEISKNAWCANVSTKYLPAKDTDIIREITEYFDVMKEKIELQGEENNELIEAMKNIDEISRRWI